MSGGSSNCNTCNASKFREKSGNDCNCMSGYSDDGTNELCIFTGVFHYSWFLLFYL